ncbi:MAG TPA: penicillin-binding protein 2, partial [Vineibacter terrae]|nr:penicillin-binding protein 2 [Vineibacter terrae]
MKRDTDRYGLFMRRALMLGAFKTGLLGILGARLYWLHAVDGEEYKVLADENRISTRPLAPTRGLIFDRTGEPLATNRNTYRLLIGSDTGRISDAMRQAKIVLRRLDRVIEISGP